MKRIVLIFCLLFPVTAFGQNHWQFNRDTTAYKQFSAGGANALVSHMSEVTVDHPRVAGKGGGMLVEGQRSNSFEYSEEFNQAGSWTPNRLTVTADSEVALDGTTTADILHEDATAASTHFISQPVNVTNNEVHVFSVYAKAINRNWIALYDNQIFSRVSYDLSNCTIGTVGGAASAAIEKLPDGWCRCIRIGTASATAAVNFQIYVEDADNSVTFNGLNQDSIYVWGAQLEEDAPPFASSYIYTSNTAPVTRTADDMTLDPHPTGTNEFVLPEYFTPTGPASKLTVYGEFKCQWSSSADLGSADRRLIEISGNGGTASGTRNRFQIIVTTANGQIQSWVRDDADADHYIRTGNNPVNFSQWFSVRAVFDFADLSRIDQWVRQIPGTESNAGMVYSGNAGTTTFDTTGMHIRLGQNFVGTVNSNCQVRSLRIIPVEVRP